MKVLSIMEFGPNQTAPPPVINIPIQTSRQSIHEITIILELSKHLKHTQNKRNEWKKKIIQYNSRQIKKNSNSFKRVAGDLQD